MCVCVCVCACLMFSLMHLCNIFLKLQDMALQQIAQINALLREADRVNMRKSFGLRKDYNPLLCIPADLYL